MFERFTDRARRVVVFAQEEARLLDHNVIDSCHLLAGIIHEGESLAAQALSAYHISLLDVRSHAEELWPAASAPAGPIPFTPAVKNELGGSQREALQLQSNSIGPEHLLLAMTAQAATDPGHILNAFEGDGKLRSYVLLSIGIATIPRSITTTIPSKDILTRLDEWPGRAEGELIAEAATEIRRLRKQLDDIRLIVGGA